MEQEAKGFTENMASMECSEELRSAPPEWKQIRKYIQNANRMIGMVNDQKEIGVDYPVRKKKE